MYLIDDKTGTLPLGSEITSVNNCPIEKIIKILYTRVDMMESYMGVALTDESKKILKSQIDMTFSGNLLFILDSDEYEITLNHNGKLKKYKVSAIGIEELNTWLFPEIDEEAKDDTFTAKDISIKRTLTNTGFVVKYSIKNIEAVEKNED